MGEEREKRGGGGEEGGGGERWEVLGDFLTALCRTVVDLTDREELKKIVRSSIGTKFIKKW